MSRITTLKAPEKLNGSVSAAAVDEFWMNVTSMPCPWKVMLWIWLTSKNSLP